MRFDFINRAQYDQKWKKYTFTVNLRAFDFPVTREGTENLTYILDLIGQKHKLCCIIY